MSKQHHRMTMLHPHFRLISLRPNVAEWRGVVHPQPLSGTYIVEVRYEQYKAPRIAIISPRLQLPTGEKRIPHTFKGDYLCLYYADYGDWTPKMYVADMIVPWISLWLIYYETWLATTEWLGGGIEHSGSEPK
jgi:hypothetical protein